MVQQPSAPNRIARRSVLSGMAAVSVVGATSLSTATTAQSAAQTVEPAGELPLNGLAEVVVDDDGTTVYCSLNDGFGVVDASDPSDPTVLYEERGLKHDGDGPMDHIRDVKVAGDRLAVVGPNTPTRGDTFSGFFLYDVSDPANPERVTFQPTEHGIHNCSFDGDRLYLTGSGLPDSPVVIYDVADDDPEELGRWAVADEGGWSDVSRNYANCHDLYGDGDTLYVAYWDTGTWVLDVSDPANPEPRSQIGGHDSEYLASLGRAPSAEFFELPGNSHYVQPNDDASALFVGKEAWNRDETDIDGGPGGIELWDGDEDPALQSVLAPPEPGPEQEGGWTSHNFGVRGDRLYTSWYGGGVRVYDVSDLAAPELLGEWRAPERSVFWSAKPLSDGFVAGSYIDPRNADEAERNGDGAKLYVFPDPDGSDATAAPTMERREFPDPPSDETTTTTQPDGSATTTPSTTSPDETTATTEGGGNDGTDGSDGEGDDGSDGGGQPGFGPLAALVGGGLGLWRHVRRTDE
ncbi:LVIVD repeat-containing protein [Halostella pelagica]|uniref:LVIVD repeat-containing protein n=1 Tax=Halostella pelagica TaxID=2583824 RepID=UPI0010800495|nr:hypothetical protein [Halostella pelagica]